MTIDSFIIRAAVIVSILITLSLIPLVSGMQQIFTAFKRVEALLETGELESQYDFDEDQEEAMF